MLSRFFNPRLVQTVTLLSVCVLSFVLAACNTTASNRYEGVWKPIDEDYNRFVITKDSMYFVEEDKSHSFQCHYTILSDSVIELERCWLEDPERPDYIAEVAIYFDENKHLVIENYLPTLALAQCAAHEYYNLVLKKR
ncbi:MAG: hypothetical protein K6A36_00525 [Paludibacteraceae bacterium]|nr:hypothetical protein [Paludibacteraceae bacterium]